MKLIKTAKIKTPAHVLLVEIRVTPDQRSVNAQYRDVGGTLITKGTIAIGPHPTGQQDACDAALVECVREILAKHGAAEITEYVDCT